MTTVSVTAEHIAKGQRDSCRFCPVALAVREAFPDADLVAVDNDLVFIELPSDVSRFIEAFDGGYDDGTVHPFTFGLDYPAVTS